MKCILFILISLYIATLQTSNSTTNHHLVVVDGVTEWTDPIANIGDTILFKHKNKYRLYIFRNKNAFNTCNFTHATHLSDPPHSTTYTWHPSRPGNFYFSFYNGSNKPCLGGQKLAVKVNAPGSHVSSPAASPSSGSPVYPWPNRPREEKGGAGEVSPAPSMAVMIPGKGGSIPFINSDPAIPLPTGQVDSDSDSATLGLLPKSVVTAYAPQNLKAVGLIKGVIYLWILCSYIVVMI